MARPAAAGNKRAAQREEQSQSSEQQHRPNRWNERRNRRRPIGGDEKGFDPQGRPGARSRGDGPPFARGQHGPRTWEGISEDDRARVRAFIEEHFPRMAEHMQRIRHRRPPVFRRRMGIVVREMLHLMNVLEQQPERGKLMIKERKLDVEMRFVAMRHRHAEDAGERAHLEEQMGALCAEAFDVRHLRLALQIDELSERVESMRALHSQQAGQRDALVAEEVKQRLRGPHDSVRPSPSDRP